MRLIDADSLRKVIEDSVSQYGSQYSADMLNMWGLFSHIINEAPTVEITEEQAIDKLHDTGWLPLHDKEMTERPTGHWMDLGVLDEWYAEVFKCSECGEEMLGEGNNFCPNCGADMRVKDELEEATNG